MSIPVYVINLIEDHTKKKSIESELIKFDVEYEIVEATNGRKLSEGYINEICDNNLMEKYLGRNLSKGEVGCALSHLKIYSKIIDNEIAHAIILEDDVNLNKIFSHIYNCENLGLPENLELLLLGYHSNIKKNLRSQASIWGKVKLNKDISLVRLCEIGYGTYGYLISFNGAKKIYNEIKNNKLYKPIDHYTGLSTHVNGYAIAPRAVHFNKNLLSESNISKDRCSLSKTDNNFKKLKAYIRDSARLKFILIAPRKMYNLYKSLLPIKGFK